MNISAPFIRRPVATMLLTVAMALAGIIAYTQLPVSPLPQVDFPTIQVSANLPGASPEIMASAVATPLERQLGHIAGVSELTSSSSLGSVNITIVFDLSRNIDAAGRDVQAAINASLGQLPSNLPSRPSFRKFNPADAPILFISLTSDTYSRDRLYDMASTILQQKVAQVNGVGQVAVNGGSLPAVRVEVNPTALNNMGLSLEDLRTAIGAYNANRPKGQLSDGRQSWAINTTDQLLKAVEYRPLLVAYRNGAPVRLSDVGSVVDSVEDTRTGGLAYAVDIGKGKPAVSLMISRQPGANIIDTVDRVRALMPQLQASVPAAVELSVTVDSTKTIRASVLDVQRNLGLSITLVILVVFFFLRDWRTTLIPSVVVPVSLVGTFGVMYLIGYSLDNLSLMSMTIATGFVVDDAIVVIENITRHIEAGMSPRQAAFVGSKEIGFTVLSISLSLIAVFIPILMMSGLVGRLFREFAVTLSVAILLSMIMSLTTTPMMCALLLQSKDRQRHGAVYRAGEAMFDFFRSIYADSLFHVLRHPVLAITALLATIGLTVYLAWTIPKGLFPQQDTGRLMGSLTADQNSSSKTMQTLLNTLAQITSDDPAVESLVGFLGGGNTARVFVSLKPLADRKASVDEVVARLRQKTASVPGGTLFFQAIQDLRTGGRGSAAQYQYTLQGQDFKELTEWSGKLLEKMKTLTTMADANSDQQAHGLQTDIVIDRYTASRLQIPVQLIDDTLYDAFGQRQVSTTYASLNQYHVVMEVAPTMAQDPNALKMLYVKPPGGKPIPLSTFAGHGSSNASLSINHTATFPSITLSFNLTPGAALSDAKTQLDQAIGEIGMPADIHGSFSGTAKAAEDAVASLPYLITAAIVAVYIVLGILYESLIHPVTILSTLPSAGVGALVALMLFRLELTIIAFIGILLLIGIVKKNAIMMIDFAIEAERREGLAPGDAIFQACMLRFRPIMMTTACALLGGMPLAIGMGVGSELRRPMGIAIVGGLIFSQAMTLYTTPVVYLAFDRLRLVLGGGSSRPMPHLPELA